MRSSWWTLSNVLLGRLSNDEGENGKKAIGFIGKGTTLHVHHAFLYISLPSLHGYDVKMPIFTFCGGREHNTTTFFLFSWPSISLLEFNPRKNGQYLTNWTRWNERDKVWSSATSLFNWRFRSRRRRCCLKLPNIGGVGAYNRIYIFFCLQVYEPITGALLIGWAYKRQFAVF